MTKIQELKLRLKDMSANIVTSRAAMKAVQKAGGAEASMMMHKLHYASLNYRDFHIAYCELRGRSRDQIEKPRKDNPPNEHAIAMVKQEYYEHHE